MMRAAGALARRQRRLSPAAALSARPPLGGAAPGEGLGALSPAAGSRPIFGLVKKWTGVSDRDTQINELQAENTAHLEAMGDLQVRAALTHNARLLRSRDAPAAR